MLHRIADRTFRVGVFLLLVLVAAAELPKLRGDREHVSSANADTHCREVAGADAAVTRSSLRRRPEERP